MLRNRTERTLAFVLAIVLMVGACKGVVYRNVIQPLANKHQQIEETKASIEKAELDVRRLEAVRSELEELKLLCLPVDPSRASVVYQDRLVALSELAGLKDAIVSPLQSIDVPNVGQRAVFSVQAECSCEKIASFIDTLESDSIPNRIALISMDRMNQNLNRLTLNVEVLAISGGDGQRKMRAPTSPTHPSPLKALVARNNPFLRAYSGPKPPEKPKPEVLVKKQPEPAKQPDPRKEDPRKFVRLVGLVEYRGETLAWLVDSRNGQESEYKTSDTIELEDWSALVLGSEGESLRLSVDGKTQRVRLGSLLSEMD